VTLGRGASDLSAVAIAAALGPAECHLVTDVAGVFDRDPRNDVAARFFPRLTHGELRRLAEAGAKVVHAEAAREAQRADVPLRIHHFRAPLDGEHGTIVTATPRSPRRTTDAAVAIGPRTAGISGRESAKAEIGPSLPRIHQPVPQLAGAEVAA
jgi:aspartokinase